MIKHLFPFGLVKAGSNIILYGAGAVGTDFRAQITATDYCNVVLWADQRHVWCRSIGLDVGAPEKIKDTEYDYVVVALLDIDKVKPFLLNMGVTPDKIIWSSRYVIDKNIMKSSSKKRSRNEANNEGLEKISASQLLSSKRMDIIARYLLARDIHNRTHNTEHAELYAKLILALNAGEEPMHMPLISAFSEYSKKKTMTEFVAAFEELVISMEENGFMKEHYIPLDDKRALANGAHRYAAALALKQDVWVKQIEGLVDVDFDWSLKWFEENSFSETDRIRLLRTFADLYSACTILVLLAPCYEQWDFITGYFSKRVNLVGSIDIDFGKDEKAYYDAVNDIYGEKVQCDSESVLKMRLCLLTDEMDEGSDIYAVTSSLSKQVRDCVFIEYTPEVQPYLMYVSKNPQEFKSIKESLLSPKIIKCREL